MRQAACDVVHLLPAEHPLLSSVRAMCNSSVLNEIARFYCEENDASSTGFFQHSRRPALSSPLAFSAAGPRARFAVELSACGLRRGSLNVQCRQDDVTGELIRYGDIRHSGPGAPCHLWWLRYVPLQLVLSGEQLRPLFTTTSGGADGSLNEERTGVREVVRALHIQYGPLCLEVTRATPHLRCLTVEDVAEPDLAPLRACHSLEELKVRRCGGPVELAPLSGHPRLRRLVMSKSHLRDLTVLPTWPLLEEVHVDDDVNGELSLTPLQGCSVLRRVSFAWVKVKDVAALRACTQLEEVDLSCDGHSVLSLEPFAHLLRLRVLRVKRAPITDVSPLRTCRSLEELNVSWCLSLESLAPLAGHPTLRRVYAGSAPVGDLAGLNTCAALEELHLGNSCALTSLASLSGCTALKVLRVENSLISDLAGLNTCAALEELNVTCCRSLTSLASLAGCTALRKLHACGAGVLDLHGLESCVALQELDISDTPVRSLEPLRACATLRELIANDLDVSVIDVPAADTRVKLLGGAPPGTHHHTPSRG